MITLEIQTRKISIYTDVIITYGDKIINLGLFTEDEAKTLSETFRDAADHLHEESD